MISKPLFLTLKNHAVWVRGVGAKSFYLQIFWLEANLIRMKTKTNMIMMRISMTSHLIIQMKVFEKSPWIVHQILVKMIQMKIDLSEPVETSDRINYYAEY